MERRINWIQFTTLLFIVVFLIYQFIGPSLVNDADISILLGAFRNDYVERGMVWLLVTNGFVHFDPIHLLMNIGAFISFASLVEKFYSPKKGFSVFILSIIGGNLAALFLVPTLTNAMIFVAIGASGGISGLLGLMIGGAIIDRRYGMGIPLDVRTFYPSLMLLILVGFFPNVGLPGTIAHIGGLVTGMLLSLVFKTHNDAYIHAKDAEISKWIYFFSIAIFVISYILLILNLLFEIVEI